MTSQTSKVHFSQEWYLAAMQTCLQRCHYTHDSLPALQHPPGAPVSLRWGNPFEACCACADIYGPSETLIGDYLEERGDAPPPVQVLTKFCCFGGDMRSVSADSVREVHKHAYSSSESYTKSGSHVTAAGSAGHVCFAYCSPQYYAYASHGPCMWYKSSTGSAELLASLPLRL